MSNDQSLQVYRPQYLGMFDEETPGVVSTFSDPVDTANAIVSATELSDHIDKIIKIANVVAHVVTVNTDDGEIQARRIILVTPDGEAYACVSKGVYNALRTLFGLFGKPPYDPALPVRVLSLKAKVGKVMTLQVERLTRAQME